MKLSDLFKAVKIEIPDTDLVIEIKPELSWFEQLEYAGIEDELKRSKFLFFRLITKWNLEDEKGNPLSITQETVEKLPPKVVIPIVEKLTEFIKKREVKKKS